jgi:hypothetical protein
MIPDRVRYPEKQHLVVLYPFMVGDETRIDPLEILTLVDIGECF